MNLRIIEDTDDLLLLELVGSLDLEGVREIETVLLAHLTFAKRPVILDFSQVTFLASFGMRMLLKPAELWGDNGSGSPSSSRSRCRAGPGIRRRKFSCGYLIRWSRCPFEAALACLTAAIFSNSRASAKRRGPAQAWANKSLRKEFGLT